MVTPESLGLIGEPPEQPENACRHALVVDGVVTNIALWDGETDWEHGADEIHELPDGSPVDIGWTRRRGKWHPPPTEE